MTLLADLQNVFGYDGISSYISAADLFNLHACGCKKLNSNLKTQLLVLRFYQWEPIFLYPAHRLLQQILQKFHNVTELSFDLVKSNPDVITSQFTDLDIVNYGHTTYPDVSANDCQISALSFPNLRTLMVSECDGSLIALNLVSMLEKLHPLVDQIFPSLCKFDLRCVNVSKVYYQKLRKVLIYIPSFVADVSVIMNNDNLIDDNLFEVSQPRYPTSLNVKMNSYCDIPTLTTLYDFSYLTTVTLYLRYGKVINTADLPRGLTNLTVTALARNGKIMLKDIPSELVCFTVKHRTTVVVHQRLPVNLEVFNCFAAIVIDDDGMLVLPLLPRKLRILQYNIMQGDVLMNTDNHLLSPCNSMMIDDAATYINHHWPSTLRILVESHDIRLLLRIWGILPSTLERYSKLYLQSGTPSESGINLICEPVEEFSNVVQIHAWSDTNIINKTLRSHPRARSLDFMIDQGNYTIPRNFTDIALNSIDNMSFEDPGTVSHLSMHHSCVPESLPMFTNLISLQIKYSELSILLQTIKYLPRSLQRLDLVGVVNIAAYINPEDLPPQLRLLSLGYMGYTDFLTLVRRINKIPHFGKLVLSTIVQVDTHYNITVLCKAMVPKCLHSSYFEQDRSDMMDVTV